MIDVMGDLIRSLLSVIWLTGALPLADAGAVSVTVVLLLAAALIVAVVASTRGDIGRSSTGAHPRRGIDVSTPLAQSDPDAAGHPRPRAPGIVATAA
jgi:hypothetical protein